MNTLPVLPRILTAGFVLALAACAGPASRERAPIQLAPSVDLPRFMGTWYLIANVPYFF